MLNICFCCAFGSVPAVLSREIFWGEYHKNDFCETWSFVLGSALQILMKWVCIDTEIQLSYVHINYTVFITYNL